jgi:type I restriction enzyme S subunit
LEALAKQLYDYWFVQFDFPNVDGKPYKSSGGKMTYNENLKRKIPEGWRDGTLLDIATFTNGLACQKFRPTDNNKLPVIKIREMHEGFTLETEYVKYDIPNAVKVFDGDVLFSWSASLEVVMWAYGDGGLNQHIFKVTSKNAYPKSFYYFHILDYVIHFKKIAEARKTTMGHITQDHLKQSIIPIPPTLELPDLLEKNLLNTFSKIISNSKEILHLIATRDEILPRLLNGQVKVGDVEKVSRLMAV